MDIEHLLEQLSPEDRQALLKRLLEEEGVPFDIPSKENSGLEKRLERLEKAVLRSQQNFDPMNMMSQMMGGMMQPPFMTSSPTMKPAQVFNALADETRLKIIKLLSEGEKNVDELVHALGIAQSTTSHHLKVLKDAHLIKSKKDGRNVFYSLSQPLGEL